MNLMSMENGPKVVNLFRSPLKYAKYCPDGTIILDNTGLKVRESLQLALLRTIAALSA